MIFSPLFLKDRKSISQWPRTKDVLSPITGKEAYQKGERGEYKYRKSTSIRHFEQCNQQLSNQICQNCDGSIKILLDVGNQQHAV